MSYQQGKPPPYEASQWPPPYQVTNQPQHPQPSYYATQPQVQTYQYFVPASPGPSYQPQPTYYVSNYIYQAPPNPPVVEPVKIAKPSKEFDWIPAVASTASHLTGRAVIGGHEADGSPLWIIRSKLLGCYWYPGKFSVRDKTASVAYLGREKQVQDIEVLCIRPENLQWIPAQNGSVPPNAIEGGKTRAGQTLYIARASHRETVTPGYVGMKQQCCVIGINSASLSLNVYEVLCRV